MVCKILKLPLVPEQSQVGLSSCEVSARPVVNFTEQKMPLHCSNSTDYRCNRSFNYILDLYQPQADIFLLFWKNVEYNCLLHKVLNGIAIINESNYEPIKSKYTYVRNLRKN